MLISVAMATYNGAKYIKEQLDSIAQQTYSKIEIVIVDDCSNDGTQEIIQSYPDERIIFIENDKNSGCTAAFQKAIENCKGDYIALCDQDDIWNREKLEILLSSIQGYSLVYSDYEFIDAWGNKILEPNKYINKLHTQDSSTRCFEIYALFNSFILGCSIMFEKDLVRKILPIYDNGYNHDKWIVLHAAINKGVKYVNKKLFYYRLHDNNLSLKIKKDNIKIKKNFFPYEVIRRSYDEIIADGKLEKLYHITKDLEKSRLKKIFVIIFYGRYIAARYKYFVRLKQIIKFVLVS